MAKDFFQDITPPNTPPSSLPPRPPREPAAEIPPTPAPGEKTIRNIQVTAKPRPRVDSMDVREVPSFSSEPPKQRRVPTRLWMWGGAGLLLLILAAITFVALRPTTVTVIPRSQTVTFDQSAHFTAYPAPAIASSTLSFTLQTSDIEDSAVVPTSGTERVSEKAQGSITVFNAYSAQPVKLVKNTRFATPDGLIFRVPADIVIPGKQGSTPGKITVTVFADEAGEKYNVGPVSRFTLPGLKSSPAMYADVYANSSQAFVGGCVGDRPAVAAGAIDTAVAQIRARLEQKARDAVNAVASDTTVVFPSLVQITYESLPQTTEAGGGLRIHERARVGIPVFPADAFAYAVAQSVSADAGPGEVAIKGGAGLTANAGDPAAIAADAPLAFTLNGTVQLVWVVDAQALASALAGKDQSAFQTIVTGFPGVQEAHARVEPFWKNSFPADPAAIRIQIEAPKDRKSGGE